MRIARMKLSNNKRNFGIKKDIYKVSKVLGQIKRKSGAAMAAPLLMKHLMSRLGRLVSSPGKVCG